MPTLGSLNATGAIYAVAALAEIAGCFAFWVWIKLERSAWWIAPGMIALALFAFLLTRVDADAAGRAYAAYIVASLLWLWLVENRAPDRWDMIGATMCIVGAGVILLAPRSAS